MTISGLFGIGKSCLIKEICFLIKERNLFKDGIIYLDLQSYERFEEFITNLNKVMNPNYEVDPKR